MTIVTAGQLARDAQEFLRFKRAMGITYWRAEFVLNGFVRFVALHWSGHEEVALEDAVTRWCARIAVRKAGYGSQRVRRHTATVPVPPPP